MNFVKDKLDEFEIDYIRNEVKNEYSNNEIQECFERAAAFLEPATKPFMTDEEIEKEKLEGKEQEIKIHFFNQ